MAGAAEPAFRNITKTQTIFLIWRVENLQLVPVPKEQYGKFFAGDSYLILSINEVGEPGGTQLVPKESKRPLELSIHFWLGESTSNDEAGVAAYKAVELDDFLGGAAVQYREAQGNESKKFISYFKSGLTILQGGAASGFHHVTDEIRQRMFQVKGKRTPLVRELPSISWEHMNDGDVYILDLQHAIYVWTGKAANRMEKLTGAKVAQGLKDDRDRPIIIVEDGEESQLRDVEKRYFIQFLPLVNKEIKSAADAGADDAAAETKSVSEIRLYRCSDEDGTLKVTEIKSGPLFQEDLSSQDSFIVDNGTNGIWVWVGKQASQKERMEAMRNAQGFSKKKNYPASTPVTRVIDGGEPVDFKALFKSWKEKNQSVGMGKTFTRGQIAKVVQTKFDAATLHENTKMAAQTQMVDDGKGTKQVYRVEDFDMKPIPESEYGQFYDGDCYVIFYSYHAGTSENFIVYYWLGSKSTADEQGTAALKAVELDDKVGGKAVQVRVVQSKEPPHFIAIFGGKIICYRGGKASGFHNLKETDVGHENSYLIQIRGTQYSHVKATEVEKRGASLNSNDVFVLVTPKETIIWAGKGSTGDEREMAKQVAQLTSKEPTVISEGQEKADFWEALGGQEAYSSDKRLQEEDKDHKPRLFQCSNASGQFKVEEIVDFNQSDLCDDDVMLLDCWDSIFIWIGNDSNENERKLSEQAAIEYLKSDPSKRDLATPIIKLKQGFEPPNFTGFFGSWDRSLWNNNKTFEEVKAELGEKAVELSLALVNI